MNKILKKINDPRQAWKVMHSLAEILMICIERNRFAVDVTGTSNITAAWKMP